MTPAYQYYCQEEPVFHTYVPQDHIDHYNTVRKALNEVSILEDGDVVPVEWLNQYEGAKSHEDISEILCGYRGRYTSISDLYHWYSANGIKSKVFIATMHYSATGEGATYRVIANQHHYLGQFIYKVETMMDLFFLKGANFYTGIPDERDPALDALLSFPMREVIECGAGNINIDLSAHINYS